MATGTIKKSDFIYAGGYATGTNCNNIPLNSFGLVWASATNSPGFLGIIFCVGTANDIRQLAFSTVVGQASTQVKSRRYADGTWSSWV